jgi:hypothetical protein
MMRRLFWVIVGALLGVTGYRRLRRLARAVTLGGRRDTAPGRARGRDVMPGGWVRGAALFTRDVREGMELYADRHPRLAGRTLEGQQARARRPQGAGPRDEDAGRAQTRVDYAKEGR